MLEGNVLVLNRLWQAVNICSVRRAFCLLYLGQAQVVDAATGYQTFTYDQWFDFSKNFPNGDTLQGVNFRIGIPKIIVLLLFERLPRKEVKLTRQNVFERDNYTCQYCRQPFDRKSLNIDHVLPRNRGGKTSWENLVCSCIECNTRKGSRTPEEARMPLLRPPRRPRLRPFLTHRAPANVPHQSWLHFLDFNNWKVELSD